jgi:DeoR/GlpR family transcriptional regulator of sugar metabolism
MNINEFETNNNAQYLKVERHSQIRRLVEERGQMTVPGLSSLFNVSEATIRRDLEEMDGQWVRRTHGGAIRLTKAVKEPPVIQRIGEQADEKQRIAAKAVAMIHEGETIYLGSGTTVREIARLLPTDIQLTVITNSLPVVNELADHPRIELMVIGGMLRQSELSMVGHIAEQAIREFRADKVFLGMRAVDTKQGFTSDYLPETTTDRAILGIAPKIILVADHTKFSRVSSVFVAPITAAHIVITDRSTDEDVISELRELGIEVNVT